MRRAPPVRVFEVDPDLLAHTDPAIAEALRRQAVVPGVVVGRGHWEPPDDPQGGLGLLVLGGLLLRASCLDGRESATLLGPGDLVRPWDHEDEGATLEMTTRWEVLEPLRLAVLDVRFARLACRCPTILPALMSRTAAQARALGVQLAVAHVPQTQPRLQLLLWHLAGRFGRVTSEGVHLPLKLTHQVLADLACVRRPSASAALASLSREELVTRRHDGTWMLHGDPPS